MGIGCGSEGARNLPQLAYPIALRCRQEIHEVARRLPVFLAFERHVEIGGGPEHVQERTQCKAFAPDIFKRLAPSALRPILGHFGPENSVLKADVRAETMFTINFVHFALHPLRRQ